MMQTREIGSPMKGPTMSKEARGELSTPVVNAVLVRAPTKRDNNLFVITCPYCHKQHSHGAGACGGEPSKFVGHRGAHCTADVHGLGYVLAWNGSEQPPKGNKGNR
jgi:hypothetical protein